MLRLIGKAAGKRLPHFPAGNIFPESEVVILGRERPRVHPVDVENAVQMIDLMLQDSGVPAGRLDHQWLGVFIESFHADPGGPRNNCCVACQAQTPFEELGRSPLGNGQCRIDQNLERYRPSIAFRSLLRRKPLNRLEKRFSAW